MIMILKEKITEKEINPNNDDKYDVNKPIGIVTPLHFIKYQEYTNNDDDKDSIEKILEYYI